MTRGPAAGPRLEGGEQLLHEGGVDDGGALDDPVEGGEELVDVADAVLARMVIPVRGMAGARLAAGVARSTLRRAETGWGGMEELPPPVPWKARWPG